MLRKRYGFQLGLIFAFLAIFTGAGALPSRAEAANPHIENVQFGQDDYGNFISFDWNSVSNPSDSCMRDLVVVWFNRYNPDGTTEGMSFGRRLFIPSGDFLSSGYSYSGFGRYGFASGLPVYGCATNDAQLSTSLPAHIKAYINPISSPYQTSFTADDFITIQIIGYRLNTGYSYLLTNDPEQYFYQVPAHPLPPLPYENVRWGFNERNELTVSFDWMWSSREISLLVGFNGTMTYRYSSNFEPDLDKDVTMTFEYGSNNNINYASWLVLRFYVEKGQHYDLPVGLLHKWTPSRELRRCGRFYICPVKRPLLESVLGRSFLPDDYITIAFTSRGYTSNDPSKYYYVDPNLEPVIIVPGVIGSRLNKVSDGEEVWPNPTKMFDPLHPSDDYLNELKLDLRGEEFSGKELYSSDIVREAIVTDPTSNIIIHKEVVYQKLIDKFLAEGYTTSTTLFAAPYDWRKNIRDELEKLDSVIKEAISHSPTGKVNIVAHSMGTLLTKEYLRQATSTDFLNKLVPIGSPQLGSPKTFKILNYGDDMNLKKWGLGLNEKKAKEVTQNMPGIYQLLPSRKYIDVAGSYVVDFRDGVDFLDYGETNSFMTSNLEDSRNPLLLDVADEFHQALDDQPFNASNVYNIVGCQHPDTIGTIRIYNEDHYDITPTHGDATVPLLSALNPSQGLDTNTYFVLYNETEIDHTDLIRKEPSLTLIRNIIKGEIGAVPTGISKSLSDCYVRPPPGFFTRILLSIHSPAELHVYDSQGQHTGPTSTADIELGIPRSNYERIGGSSFAFVPPGDTYRVVARAISEGSFDIKIRLLQGIDTVDTITYLGIPLEGSNTIAEVNFTGLSGDLSLNIDNDGDGVIDRVIAPTAILSGSESGDITPPEITMPDVPEEVMLNTPITFDFTVTDDISGVALIKAALDDTEIEKDDVIEMSSIGEHTLIVKAVDRAGNPRTSQLNFNVIYNFSGFLSPLRPSETYRQRRTLPVKFQLTDTNGEFIDFADTHLYIAKITEGIIGDEEPAVSTSRADTDNRFRYDYEDNQYIFNLSTKEMSEGEWQLRIELDDGESYNVIISIQ